MDKVFLLSQVWGGWGKVFINLLLNQYIIILKYTYKLEHSNRSQYKSIIYIAKYHMQKLGWNKKNTI